MILQVHVGRRVYAAGVTRAVLSMAERHVVPSAVQRLYQLRELSCPTRVWLVFIGPGWIWEWIVHPWRCAGPR